METYKDHRLLFLADANFNRFDDVLTVLVIDGWNWYISGSGKGYLMSPEEEMHCRFDLMAGQITYAPRGETISAPGLSASLVQEMGERYAYDVMFSKEEQAAYDEHVRIRDNTKKAHDQEVRKTLKGVIQLERKDGSWLAHVDKDRVMELTGIDAPHVCSRKDGEALFNRMSEHLHAAPLRDPAGYMALEGNMYEQLFKEYRNQYEDMLQAIDNQMIDGTGYSVSHVLDTLQSTVRKDVKEFLPKGEEFGDLRFVKATEERKQAVTDFVKHRVDKTLTYEKKRSYEKDTLARTHSEYMKAGERLRESLQGMSSPETVQGDQL